jgi:hypothetical protein
VQERNGPAADTALELMKQLIALSSGVLALSATFVGEFSTKSLFLIFILALAWLSLTVSVLAGIQTISAIVKSRLDENYDWSAGWGRTTARISKFGFVFGLGLFALFALMSLARASGDEPDANCASSKIMLQCPHGKKPEQSRAPEVGNPSRDPSGML